MSLEALYREVAEGQEYIDKMNHAMPTAPVISREEYLMKAARNKVVLDIGASGPMASGIQQMAREYHAIDMMPNPGIENYYQIDLDGADKLPEIDGLELIIAGEVIEHVSNAGHFLDLLWAYQVPVIMTTPNAFSNSGWRFMQKGIEHVNIDHVSWYSYHTLKNLIERHNFRLLMWFWYNGEPLIAEGLIFHTEPISNGGN